MSDNIKVIEILAEMEEILDEASGFPLSKKVGIDKDEFIDLIAELREALPYELERALKIINEENVIIESARNDANFILDEAKKERDQKIKECNDEIIIKNKHVEAEIENMMKEATLRAEELVSDSKIIKEARAKANRLVKEATEYARDMREGAKLYSIDQLNIVEATLSEMLDEVRSNKSQL